MNFNLSRINQGKFQIIRAIVRCVSPISRFQPPKISKIRENFDVRFDSRFSKECNENWRTKMPLRTCVGNRGDMRNCGATFRKKICAIFDHMLNLSLVKLTNSKHCSKIWSLWNSLGGGNLSCSIRNEGKGRNTALFGGWIWCWVNKQKDNFKFVKQME